MDEVYLAQDAKLDRKVALKILPAEVAVDRNRMSRFVQEAKTAAGLKGGKPFGLRKSFRPRPNSRQAIDLC